jgi:hypothetical protein
VGWMKLILCRIAVKVNRQRQSNRRRSLGVLAPCSSTSVTNLVTQAITHHRTALCGAAYAFKLPLKSN